MADLWYCKSRAHLLQERISAATGVLSVFGWPYFSSKGLGCYSAQVALQVNLCTRVLTKKKNVLNKKRWYIWFCFVFAFMQQNSATVARSSWQVEYDGPSSVKLKTKIAACLFSLELWTQPGWDDSLPKLVSVHKERCLIGVVGPKDRSPLVPFTVVKCQPNYLLTEFTCRCYCSCLTCKSCKTAFLAASSLPR